MNRRYRDFPYNPCSHTCTDIFNINIPLKNGVTTVLWTPGTAQIWEGIEDSWGDLEDSEEEDEDESGSNEAIFLDSIKMDTGLEVSNTGTQDTPYSALKQWRRRNDHFSYFKKIRTHTIIATQIKAPSDKAVDNRKKKRPVN